MPETQETKYSCVICNESWSFQEKSDTGLLVYSWISENRWQTLGVDSQKCLIQLLEGILANTFEMSRHVDVVVENIPIWPGLSGCIHCLKTGTGIGSVKQVYDWIKYAYGDTLDLRSGLKRQLWHKEVVQRILQAEQLPARLAFEGGYWSLADGTFYFCSVECALKCCFPMSYPSPQRTPADVFSYIGLPNFERNSLIGLS